MRTRQLEHYEAEANPQQSFRGVVTIGTVVDTNDPQQMGRVRVVCPVLGETMRTSINDLPWAVYITPFGGTTEVGTRGPNNDTSTGPIAHGIWTGGPPVGSQVIVMFIDGDANLRVFFGAIYDQFRPHTMPHGRFMYDDHPALEKADDRRPFGPYTSNEKYIEPLNTNLRQAFPKSEPNYEWRTRAADYTVSAIDVEALNYTSSRAQDDKGFSWDGWESRQGYEQSRTDPNFPGLFGEGNLDNMVYSWVTPGFHGFSMDDRQQNCRMRIRTTAGHQIILDDTNERIYISTAKGKNWIDIDQEGNIDMYTDNKVNIRAKKDINFTSDETIRMYAKKGIHMYSEDEIRMQALKDIHVKGTQNLRLNVAQNIYLQSAQEINVKSGTDLKLTSGGTTHQNAGGSILDTAPAIHHNGPGAAIAGSSGEQPAKWTSRVPDHEPWARVMTQNDFTHAPEFPYTSPQVGKVERGQQIRRGKYWRR